MATNAATEPKAATITPPIAGPKLRAMLKEMLFSEIAAGSIFGGTCSLTEACHAGPYSAMPLPIRKQNTSRLIGSSRPNQATAHSATEHANVAASETSPTMRRSYMSAIAPAGIEISITGSITAVCTSATISGDAAICVIAQAAPTPWISDPKFDVRFASQIRRNRLCFSGAPTSSSLNMLSRVSLSAYVIALR